MILHAIYYHIIVVVFLKVYLYVNYNYIIVNYIILNLSRPSSTKNAILSVRIRNASLAVCYLQRTDLNIVNPSEHAVFHLNMAREGSLSNCIRGGGNSR